MLLSLHILILVISFFLIIINYLKYPYAVIINIFTYLLFFSLLYLGIPSIYILYIGISPLVGKVYNIDFVAGVSLYIECIFLIFFLLSLINKKNKIPYEIKPINIKILKYITTAICLLIFLYILSLILVNIDVLYSVYGNRRLQSDFESILISKYKINFLFFILIMLVIFLYFITRKLSYLLFLVPFLAIDLLLSSRYFILVFIILFIILYTYNNKKISIKSIIISFLILVSIGLFRSTSLKHVNISNSILEFLYTYSSSFLILGSSFQANFLNALAHSLGNIFIINPYNLFFPTYIDYKTTMSDLNPFRSTMGLGGSLITEIIAFKNIYIILMIPIFIAIYGVIMNLFLRSKFIWFRINGIFFIIFSFGFYRGSLFDLLFYSFRLTIFFGFWIIWVDTIACKNMKKVRYEVTN